MSAKDRDPLLTAEASPRLPYVPALDGLRALCLAGVLCFHQPFDWMPGGFLGVSAFFTLSGYLITRLLFAEHARRGRIDLGAFWLRRLRRLLPALWLAVMAVVVSGRWWLSIDALERLPGDALSSFFFVSNWHFMSPEYAYALLFTAPSALQHCWSLAIEAQLYLVFPLIVAASLARRGGPRRFVMAMGLSILVSLVLAWNRGPDEEASYRIYYGTGARAGELLIGALVGLIDVGPRPRRGRGWGIAGAAALALMLLLWTRLQVESAWLYRGGFAVHALLSALVIAGATHPGSLLQRGLSARGLRWIGEASYGAYLYHWPIFLVLDEGRTGLSGPVLFALRVGATLLCAGLSLRFVERPIRRGARWRGRALGRAFAAASLALVAALGVAQPAWPERLWRGLTDRLEAPRAKTFRFAVFGDSTAASLNPYLRRFLQARGGQATRGSVRLGCGLVTEGRRLQFSRWVSASAGCAAPETGWLEHSRRGKIDLAIVLTGTWDVHDHRFEGDPRIRRLGDPRFDRRVRSIVDRTLGAFAEHGADVVWLASPHFIASAQRPLHPGDAPAMDPKRMDRLNEIIAAAVATHPEMARLVDLGAILAAWPGGAFDPELRPDGVHLYGEAPARLVEDYLGVAILEAWTEIRQARAER